MKKVLVCLLFLGLSSQAFADAAADFAKAFDRDNEIARIQAEAEAKILAQREAAELEKNTWIEAKNIGLDVDQFEYSRGEEIQAGYIQSDKLVCQYRPSYEDFDDMGETRQVNAFLRCYENPSLSYSTGAAVKRSIGCAVGFCSAEQDFSEAKEIEIDRGYEKEHLDSLASAATELKSGAFKAIKKSGRNPSDYSYESGYLQSKKEICHYVGDSFYAYDFDAYLYCFKLNPETKPSLSLEEHVAAFNAAMAFQEAQEYAKAEASLKAGTLEEAKTQGKDLSKYSYSKGGFLQSESEVCRYGGETDYPPQLICRANP